MTDLGQRVKNFRKARSLTQEQLELAIGASFGHISRIESGKLNPTKETLFKISEVLKLTGKDTDYLLGVGLGTVTAEEIKNAIHLTQEYLDSSVYPAYLADDFFFVRNWNNKMLELLGADPKFAEPLKGINNLEVLFNPDLPFRPAIPANRWRKVALNQLIFLIREENYLTQKNEKWLVDLIDRLKEYPDFEELWEKAEKNYRQEIMPGENVIYFKDGNGKERGFFMSVTRVNACPRFRITEYIPQKEKAL